MNDRSITPARIWFRFLRMHQRLHAAMTGRLRAIGLSVAQFDLLSTLTESNGMTQRDLAERLYVTKGNVSGLVDRLVEAGMLDRRPVPGDRRSHSLHLTPEGRRLALEGMALQERFIEETLGKFPSQDLQALDAIMTRWRDIYRSVEAKD
jgi:DNA-binding MarR family transcriptional regulator